MECCIPSLTTWDLPVDCGGSNGGELPKSHTDTTNLSVSQSAQIWSAHAVSSLTGWWYRCDHPERTLACTETRDSIIQRTNEYRHVFRCVCMHAVRARSHTRPVAVSDFCKCPAVPRCSIHVIASPLAAVPASRPAHALIGSRQRYSTFVLVVSGIRPNLPTTIREESHGRIALHVVAAILWGMLLLVDSWRLPFISLDPRSRAQERAREGRQGQAVARQGTAGPGQLWAV